MTGPLVTLGTMLLTRIMADEEAQTNNDGGIRYFWATAEYPATLYHHCFRWSAFFEERSITQ